ncbi:unnamed protein product [Tilletia laevis]|uniref:Uncharacterized protein n=2 Tax=Tilletia TaxID=13289 RepID=A0ABN7IVD6_9BASI|nr:hypothetical protein CF336_g6339 [Tilletia laevis]KAE8201868.1 hypothetical protein CF335_g3640 [Tilletia laevis]CAD6922348.1 unnamed protein product [Tilletia caries]CAD6923904.1 unnamed protein product [Tilletia caries]CAD6934372.1 unnamed protein product [Tilletia laevis]
MSTLRGRMRTEAAINALLQMHNGGRGRARTDPRPIKPPSLKTYSSEACSQKNGECQRSMTSMERIRPDVNVVLSNLNTAGTDSVLDWNHLRAIPSSFWRNGFVATIPRWTVGQD